MSEREYIEHIQIIREVDGYEKWKADVLSKNITTDETTFNMLKFLDNYGKRSPNLCRKTCWAGFIERYRFAQYATITASVRSRYTIYPNADPANNIMDPKTAFMFGQIPEPGFMLEYDFRAKIVAADFYDIMMLDYDIKDEATREKVVSELQTVIAIGHQNNVNLAFAIFPTDRGIHAFLISHPYERNYMWIDFMRLTCNDANYTAFSFARGFGIRLTKKLEQPEDVVSWVEPIETDLVGNELESIVDTRFAQTKLYSRYLNRSISIRYFNDDLIILGNKSAVLPQLFYRIRLQYILMQYYRNLSLDDIAQLECDIYNAAIYPYSSRIVEMQRDVISLNLLNNTLPSVY